MKNSLMITLKRRMIWRGNKTVIEVKRAAGFATARLGTNMAQKAEKVKVNMSLKTEILKGRQEVRKKDFFSQLYTDKCFTAVTK